MVVWRQRERWDVTALVHYYYSVELRYPWAVAHARREFGRIDLASGDLAGAEGHLRDALETLTGLGMRFEVALTRLDLAELASRQSDLEAAMEHLDSCRMSFTELGAPAYLERAELLAREFDARSSRAREARRRA